MRELQGDKVLVRQNQRACNRQLSAHLTHNSQWGKFLQLVLGWHQSLENKGKQRQR